VEAREIADIQSCSDNDIAASVLRLSRKPSEEPYIVVFGRDVPTYVHKIAPRRPEFKMTRTLSDVVTIRCGLSINHIEGGKQFHIVNTSTSFCWS